MKKYRVEGTTTVTIYKEVWANSEEEAYEKAYEQLSELNEYCGNGSDSCLIGVENEGESVSVCDIIDYNDIEELEDDPDYFACPECDGCCERRMDSDGIEYWYCDDFLVWIYHHDVSFLVFLLSGVKFISIIINGFCRRDKP